MSKINKSSNPKYFPPLYGALVVICIFLIFAVLLYLAIPLVISGIINPIGRVVVKAASGGYENAEIIVTIISLIITYIFGTFLNQIIQWIKETRHKRFDIRANIISNINEYALMMTRGNLTNTEKMQIVTQLKVIRNLSIIYFNQKILEIFDEYLIDPTIENYGVLMQEMKGLQ